MAEPTAVGSPNGQEEWRGLVPTGLYWIPAAGYTMGHDGHLPGAHAVHGPRRVPRRAARARRRAPAPRRAAAAALERLGLDALAEAAGSAATRSSCSRGSPSRSPARTAQRRDRAWPLDLVPRVITAAEWTHDQARARPAHPGAERVRRRRLPRARDRPCRDRPVVADRQPPELRPAGARVRAAGRRLLPRVAAATSSAAATAAGGCWRTTSAPRRGSPTCSRTGWR